MYIAFACGLAAVCQYFVPADQPLQACILVGRIIAWITVLGFVVYITYFQIIPEEQLMRQKFGSVYERYCESVPRWLFQVKRKSSRVADG